MTRVWRLSADMLAKERQLTMEESRENRFKRELAEIIAKKQRTIINGWVRQPGIIHMRPQWMGRAKRQSIRPSEAEVTALMLREAREDASW